MERQDVRVPQPSGQPDLAQEAFRPDRGGDLRPQDLHGDAPIVSQVVGEEHRGHAAAAELTFEHVPVGEGRLEARQWIAHTPISSTRVASRSEEHTSELQSLAYLVCRLL